MDLGREVAVQRAQRDIGALGDRAHLHGFVTALAGQGEGGIEDAPAPVTLRGRALLVGGTGRTRGGTCARRTAHRSRLAAEALRPVHNVFQFGVVDRRIAPNLTGCTHMSVNRTCSRLGVPVPIASTAEHRAITAAVRAWADRARPLETVRAQEDDPSAWQR